MSRDPLDYKEGRGDYYLAEGKRAMSTDERSSEQQPKVRPSTDAGRDLLDNGHYPSGVKLGPEMRRYLSEKIVDIEGESRWNYMTDYTPPDPCAAERDRLEAALRLMVEVFADGHGVIKVGPYCYLTDEGHAAIEAARAALGEAEASEETGR